MEPYMQIIIGGVNFAPNADERVLRSKTKANLALHPLHLIA